MSDVILARFLQTQLEEGLSLSRASNILTLIPLPLDFRPSLWQRPNRAIAVSRPSAAPSAYEARYSCRGLVFDKATNKIREANQFRVHIRFPSNYLRRVEKSEHIVSLLSPLNTFHPNIWGPFICLGRISPGMGLVDILYQVFEILTYYNFKPGDPLNPDAAAYARRHSDRFPTDTRPLRLPSQGDFPHE